MPQLRPPEVETRVTTTGCWMSGSIVLPLRSEARITSAGLGGGAGGSAVVAPTACAAASTALLISSDIARSTASSAGCGTRPPGRGAGRTELRSGPSRFTVRPASA